eukprot:CAMPEP_0176419732 /NCGR_PEP_ID=MMETSP0127-20121128/8218_1 /TAXON_ID=938130 /ORGANISM="Platyophrya macrostoma, Strain WH" /LENGTH=89 /DNA_ID=CAMNT_0017800257 /DNA_START=601 /DNA_END=870 /DNA_ORIENTATION=+
MALLAAAAPRTAVIAALVNALAVLKDITWVLMAVAIAVHQTVAIALQAAPALYVSLATTSLPAIAMRAELAAVIVAPIHSVLHVKMDTT